MFAETILLHSSSLGFVVVCVFWGDEGRGSQVRKEKREEEEEGQTTWKTETKKQTRKRKRVERKKEGWMDGWEDESYFFGTDLGVGKGRRSGMGRGECGGVLADEEGREER